MTPARSGVAPRGADTSRWVQRFHAGDRAVLEEVYREHFDTVARAVSLLPPADQETAIHEVFLRLLSQPALRQSFCEGSLGAWLAVVARNHAIDWARRSSREISVGGSAELQASDSADSGEAGTHARVLVERFQREVLPAKWARVFEARFLRQLTQVEAAELLGVQRTTLAYQEARVRRLLRRFLLGGRS
jgi:RNA polymerase sigma-70 factor (ECF subfamily)